MRFTTTKCLTLLCFVLQAYARPVNIARRHVDDLMSRGGGADGPFQPEVRVVGLEDQDNTFKSRDSQIEGRSLHTNDHDLHIKRALNIILARELTRRNSSEEGIPGKLGTSGPQAPGRPPLTVNVDTPPAAAQSQRERLNSIPSEPDTSTPVTPQNWQQNFIGFAGRTSGQSYSSSTMANQGSAPASQRASTSSESPHSENMHTSASPIQRRPAFLAQPAAPPNPVTPVTPAQPSGHVQTASSSTRRPPPPPIRINAPPPSASLPLSPPLPPLPPPTPLQPPAAAQPPAPASRTSPPLPPLPPPSPPPKSLPPQALVAAHPPAPAAVQPQPISSSSKPSASRPLPPLPQPPNSPLLQAPTSRPPSPPPKSPPPPKSH